MAWCVNDGGKSLYFEIQKDFFHIQNVGTFWPIPCDDYDACDVGAGMTCQTSHVQCNFSLIIVFTHEWLHNYLLVKN